MSGGVGVAVVAVVLAGPPASGSRPCAPSMCLSSVRTECLNGHRAEALGNDPQQNRCPWGIPRGRRWLPRRPEGPSRRYGANGKRTSPDREASGNLHVLPVGLSVRRVPRIATHAEGLESENWRARVRKRSLLRDAYPLSGREFSESERGFSAAPLRQRHPFSGREFSHSGRVLRPSSLAILTP